MSTRYYKRYRMEFQLRNQSIPEPVLPDGYLWIPWEEQLVETHARVKAECFSDEIDATVFPCLSHLAGCKRLMYDISSRKNFLPRTTWLIARQTDFGDSCFCGTIQGVRKSYRTGAIQNVGIIPECRGLGLGKALVARSLIGFKESGIHRVHLEVTAVNANAVQLYQSLGFRVIRTLFKSVEHVDTVLT